MKFVRKRDYIVLSRGHITECVYREALREYALNTMPNSHIFGLEFDPCVTCAKHAALNVGTAEIIGI
jgi:hypothetical protein